MAIIREYVADNGIRVRIADDCYWPEAERAGHRLTGRYWRYSRRHTCASSADAQKQEKGECTVMRYDRIMQAISPGLSDSEIAAKHGTDSATIHVYRMVHDGTLPRYPDLTYNINRYGGWERGGETIADRLARTIKGWHA